MVKNSYWLHMEKVNLTKMFFLFGMFLRHNMNSFWNIQWRPVCYGLDQECGNNIQRILMFDNTIIHNFHKGCWWSYSNSSSQVTQQTINCLTYTKRSNFLSSHFLQKHFESFFQIQRIFFGWCQMFIYMSFILKK
jgi:hypothetical protein